MAGSAGFDAQAAMRLTAEELDSHLKELLGWSKEMKGRQRGAGQPQAAARAPAAAPAAETIRPATPAAAVKASSGSSEQQGAAASKPIRHPAAHTYEHYRDKWDRFDVDAALAEEEEQEAGGAGGGTRGGSGSAISKGSRPAGFGADTSSRSAAAQVPQARVTVPVSETGPSAVPAPGAAAPTSAEGWKDAGNVLFKQGAYQKAANAYSRSLQMQPGCLSYANRAMALLKLGRNAEAEADCSRAVELDAAYVKAYQRRATARRQLGNLLGAVEDCEWVLRLEPNNKQAAADRAEWAAELLRQEGLELPSRAEAVPVVLAGVKSGRGAMPAAAAAADQQAPEAVIAPRKQAAAAAAGTVGQEASSPDGRQPLLTEARTQRLSPAAAASGAAVPAAAVQAVASAAACAEGQEEEDEPMPDLPPEEQTAAMAAEQPEQPPAAGQEQRPAGSPAAPAQQVATPARQEAAAPAAGDQQREQARTPAGQPQQQKAATMLAVIPASPPPQPSSIRAPRTGVEFEKGWKACKGDTRLQAAYLLTLQPAALPALLKQALTPGLLTAAASSLLGPGLEKQPAAAVALLGAFPAVPRFDLNLLSVPQRQRGEVARQWDAAAAGLGAKQGGEDLAAARQRWKL